MVISCLLGEILTYKNLTDNLNFLFYCVKVSYQKIAEITTQLMMDSLLGTVKNSNTKIILSDLYIPGHN